jgi:hypothetical protein
MKQALSEVLRASCYATREDKGELKWIPFQEDSFSGRSEDFCQACFAGQMLLLGICRTEVSTGHGLHVAKLTDAAPWAS